MSGVALTTISPSSTSSRRSTPCVEGCCGPIEIVICVSSGRSMTSNCGGRLLIVQSPMSKVQGQCPQSKLTLDFGHWTLDLSQTVRFIPAQRKIFAERVAFPIVGQQDATQIRVAVEMDAEQVKGLTLMPVGCSPNA